MAGLTRLEWLVPDWPAPDRIRAAVSTRLGGVSHGGYASLNLADHVGDEVALVAENRRRLAGALSLPEEPRWLEQVHGTAVISADDSVGPAQADGSWSSRAGVVCAVLTADCLPVLMCDRAGTTVAAIHAGWRGMCAGILQTAVRRFTDAGISPEDILVWFGPAISAGNYEVDDALQDRFISKQRACTAAFSAGRSGHWQLDLYAAARSILMLKGIHDFSGGDSCTYDDERFYSYRRAAVCGRQASLVWIAE
ncbi:MAG: peptidoglycan editing factor PgeF [Gammaproteobacteria bacterium]|jgi:YfiH family protein